jgi:alpha-D-xyloside xylohydrolase
MHWNDAAHTLTIGARKGSFPGMLEKRTFRVVLVAPQHGVGIGAAAVAKTVAYSGESVTIKP